MKNIKFLIIAFVLSLILIGCGSGNIVIKQYLGEKVINTITVEKNESAFDKIKAPNLENGFSFKGWFFDKEFKLPVKKDSSFKKDLNIYAKVIENKYEIFFYDINTKSNISFKKDVLHHTAMSSEFMKELESKQPSLTLDSYYIDENCMTKFTNQENIKKLYTTFKAKYTYHNGFEEVKTELLSYGKTPTKIDLEKLCENFPYMDKDNISFSNITDPTYDLNAPALKNTDILVKWQSKGLKFSKNEKENVLTLFDIDDNLINNPAVISIPGEAIYKGQKYKVSEINLSIRHLQEYGNLTKLIIDDNIKSIINLNFTKNYSPNLESIILPKELVIIENSFNSLSDKIKKLALPEKVEIIISSFWDYEIDKINLPTKYFKNSNLEITIPSSVKYLSNIPENLIITDSNPNFYYKNRRIYNKEKDTLIAAFDVNNSILDLRNETVKYIYPLAFDFITFDLKTLCLPKTFEEVKIYPNASDYKFYTGCALNQERNNETNNYLSITTNASKLNYIIIDQFKLGAKLNQYFITSLKKGSFEYLEAIKFDNKILLSGENTEKQTQKVTINFILGDKINPVSFEIEHNNVLNKEDLLSHITDIIIKKALEKTVKDGSKFNSFIDLLPQFTIGDKVLTNLYLLININVDILSDGIELKYEVEADEVTITGIITNVSELYLPKKIDGKNVTKIAKDAFKDNNFIKFIYIPNTVKVIEENAFLNAKLLTNVLIQSTTNEHGIEFIKRGAFENSSLETIVLPLNKMIGIEPYAFKTFTMKEFIVPNDEIKRTFTNSRATHDDIEYIPEGQYVDCSFDMFSSFLEVDKIEIYGKENKFYILKDNSLSKIVRYKGNRKIEYNGKEIVIIDVELISSANKCQDGFSYNILMLGTDAHHRGKPIATICYELMEGSVYLEGQKGGAYGSVQQINLIAIKKAHKNSVYIKEGSETLQINFVTGKYINIKLLKHAGLKNELGVFNDLCFLTRDDMKNKENFEEGWINIELDIDKLDYCQTPGSI